MASNLWLKIIVEGRDIGQKGLQTADCPTMRPRSFCPVYSMARFMQHAINVPVLAIKIRTADHKVCVRRKRVLGPSDFEV